MRRFHRQATVKTIVVCLLGALPPFVFAQSSSVSNSAVIDALQKGQFAIALHLSSEALRTTPRSFKLWTLRAVALEHCEQPVQALEAYKHALTLSPDYLPALEGAAQLDYKTQSTQAVPLLRHILVLQPANSTAHAMLGVLEYRQADYSNAAQDLAAADQVLGSQPSSLMAYAICLARLDRVPEAIVRLQQLLALRPLDADARFDLALLQWRADKSAEALVTMQPLLDAHSIETRGPRLAAAIHEANNETPQAVELLRAAILANPDESANYVDFATLSFAHNSFTVGIDILNRGIARIPNAASLYMARGVLYGQNGDFEKAIADFEQAHRLDPASSMSATAEGIAQSQRHNHEAALDDFRRQVREHPQDAYAYYLLAEGLSWSPPEAKAEVDSGAKQDSISTSVTQAITAARRAIELDPHLVQADNLLASLYLQVDQPDEAVNACRAALKLNPKDQQAVYSLILALRKTGQKDEIKGLVQTLTDLRKADQTGNSQKARYGRLVEAP